MSTKLKPFDLEAALRGEPVVTRDGREVTQVTKFVARGEIYPIYAVVDGDVYSYTILGEYDEERPSSRNDLFMATKTVKKDGWVVIRNANIDIPAYGQSIFDNKAAAQDYADKRGYGIVTKIEWEEEV